MSGRGQQTHCARRGRSRLAGGLLVPVVAGLLAACADRPDSSPCEAPARALGPSVALFDGRSLSGWDGDPAVWRVEGGEIVGSTGDRGIRDSTFLIFAGRTYADFALTVEVLLVGGAGNSGVQLRSRIVDPVRRQVVGYQADIGPGLWGLLYDEGLERGVLAYPSDECRSAVLPGDWNRYEIVANGCSVTLRLNGVLCTEFGEGQADRAGQGYLALQYHAPGGFEVRFRNVRVAELL